MGQYYKPVLLVEDGTVRRAECYWPWDFGNGAKLTEHSWIGNDFVNAVMSRMAELTRGGATIRLAWVGDYSDDVEVPGHEGHHEEGCAVAWGEYVAVHSPLSRSMTYDLYVHDMDRDEYVKVPGRESDDVWTLHPVPLLTAVGNGEGGGDYEGTSMDLVGTWAYDEIRVTAEEPSGAREIVPGFVEAE